MLHHLSFNAFEFLVNFFNFIILLAIFYQIVIVGLSNMIASRGRAVLSRLDEAKMLKREATLADIRRQEQLDGLLEEITEFRELNDRDRQHGILRVAAESELEAKHIVEQAHREARELIREAQEDYQKRITTLAVQRVEKKLAALLTQESHQDLVQNFLRKVGTLRA